MFLSIRRTLTALSLCFACTLEARSTRVDVYSGEELAASHVAGQKTNPLAPVYTDILERYPNHYTMYVVRHGDGQSEWHESMADIFFVLKGEAQLCTGGSMQGDKDAGPGERRGTGLKDATCVPLKQGEVIHIPASVPHQVHVASGATFAYFVVKVSEVKTYQSPTAALR